ncbi:chloride channel protein [Mumia sp. zg.B21]|uniref:chloride channel protein n=1 Tax=Mumia sp. zg.B21 TaxID=2855447 RepID=UPI001C6E769F|nr:chloride channel protein [Mumia sp. zg.B21]MBW9211006.1 chloride channel protein [Mumia sp. zg.B21]
MADTSGELHLAPLARSREFWVLIRDAVVFGVVMAFAGLAFLFVVETGDFWGDPTSQGWWGGHWWWIAVTVGTGLVVGLLRHVLRMPEHQPGLTDELEKEHVEPAGVLGTVAVSSVSLVGGASLGPEAALGSMGGGLGTWVGRRRTDEDMQKATTLTGISAAYGGLLAVPMVATLLVLELAKPHRRRFTHAVFGSLASATVCFAVFYPIAGTTFLGLYDVPSYAYKDWHLLAAVGLGLAAALGALVLAVLTGIVRRLAARLEGKTVLRPVAGGLAFGLIAVALPLTLFTGSHQLQTVAESGSALGAGFLLVIVLAKMVAFSVCMETGFIGGPFFPMLFLGGTYGYAIHLIVPDVPLALAFSCVFAALPGAIVAAPFTLVLLAALMMDLGALQTVPVAVAVLTSYIAVTGSGVLAAMVQARASRHAAARQPGFGSGGEVR